MGLVTFGVPMELVLLCKKQFGIEHFVETGTFRGDTAWAAMAQFPRVFTVELDAARHVQVVERFRPYPGVTCLQGHSPAALERIVAEIGTAPALYWLDAHWCADASSFVQGSQCPVLQEVEVLNRTNADAFILVDDARLFFSPPPPPHDPDQWPTLVELVPALSANRRRLVTVVDDVIIAFPMRARELQRTWGLSRPAAWAPAAAPPAGRGLQVTVNRQR